MSPLWRDQLRITLGPEQVTLLRLGRGLHPEVVARHAEPCAASAPEAKPWAAALQSLETGLRALGGDRIDAQVVLSSHFVRYALVPWSDQISDRDEEQAFIRLCFAQTYGAEAQHWAMRMSANGYGETQVACAIDQGLLDGLEGVAETHGLRLVSVQPHLMAAFNQWREQLQAPVAWFATAEPGRLCVSLLEQGRWSSLRSMKTGADWQAALHKLLEREFLVSESGLERGTVYLCAAEAAELPGWTVQHLAALAERGAQGRRHAAASRNG